MIESGVKTFFIVLAIYGVLDVLAATYLHHKTIRASRKDTALRPRVVESVSVGKPPVTSQSPALKQAA